MRIYQQPLDEYTLWDHLQAGEFERAKDVIDWYYSKTNPEGFDDPHGITKAELIKASNKVPRDLTSEHQIKKRRIASGAPLLAAGVLASFFVFLSVLAGSWMPILIPLLLVPFLIPAVFHIFDRTPIITINPQQLEFRKSTNAPIKWNNILQIYLYQRKPIRGAGTFSSASFIEIYRKNSVKPESYNIDDLELQPSDIVFLVNEYKNKYES